MSGKIPINKSQISNKLQIQSSNFQNSYSLTLGIYLLFGACNLVLVLSICIRSLGDDRDFLEILRRRRRGGLPLERGGIPGVVAGLLSRPERPDQIIEQNEQACREDPGTDR